MEITNLELKPETLMNLYYMLVYFQTLMVVATFDPNSQVMPLTADIVYDPNQEHEWHSEKEVHISNIKTWIEEGAKDMFGNPAIQPNSKPEMQGVVAFVTGTTTALPRIGRGTIQVPAGTQSLDIWFSVTDDNLFPYNLTYNKVKFSKNLFQFHLQEEISLNVVNTPILEAGYYASNQVEYYHNITHDISDLVSGDEVFIKIYVKDDVNEITEIPIMVVPISILNILLLKFYNEKSFFLFLYFLLLLLSCNKDDDLVFHLTLILHLLQN